MPSAQYRGDNSSAIGVPYRNCGATIKKVMKYMLQERSYHRISLGFIAFTNHLLVFNASSFHIDSTAKTRDFFTTGGKMILLL